MVTEDMEGIEGVAKSASHFVGGPALDQVGTQGFVLAMFGEVRFEEEPADLN